MRLAHWTFAGLLLLDETHGDDALRVLAAEFDKPVRDLGCQQRTVVHVDFAQFDALFKNLRGLRVGHGQEADVEILELRELLYRRIFHFHFLRAFHVNLKPLEARTEFDEMRQKVFANLRVDVKRQTFKTLAVRRAEVVEGALHSSPLLFILIFLGTLTPNHFREVLYGAGNWERVGKELKEN